MNEESSSIGRAPVSKTGGCGFDSCLSCKKKFLTVAGMIKKTKKFLYDVQFEMKKVSWPTFDELRGAVYVVLTLSLLVAVFLFIVDLLLNRAMSVLL